MTNQRNMPHGLDLYISLNPPTPCWARRVRRVHCLLPQQRDFVDLAAFTKMFNERNREKQQNK